MDITQLDFSKGNGLLPVIVQDVQTRQVLMQAYMNHESLKLSLESGKATFFSRSRKRLWTKGESSGNYMYISEILADCDQDCLLVKVKPAGPACHTGTKSCFNQVLQANAIADSGSGPEPSFLSELETLLSSRKEADTDKSYTARLFKSGPKRIAKKLGEEAIELILEAEAGEKQRFIEEAADLIYHLNVLLLAREMGWREVIQELQARYKPG